MSKKLLITGLAAIVIVATTASVQLKGRDAAVQTPTFGDIIAEAQAASVDYFLKIDGIDGESNDDKHKNEIDILSWSWGESNAGTQAGGGGGGAGKVSMQDFHFTMKINKATPKLMLAVAKGEHIREAKLTVRDSSRKNASEFYVITLKDVLVSSFQTGGSAGDVPTESVSLNFAKIEWSYTAQDGEVITGGWDVAGNVEI